MISLRSLAIAALSTASLALGAEEAPPADASALTIFSDKAWDCFSRGELHAEQPVWHPETGILSSSGLACNQAGQPIYTERLSYLFPDGKHLVQTVSTANIVGLTIERLTIDHQKYCALTRGTFYLSMAYGSLLHRRRRL